MVDSEKLGAWLSERQLKNGGLNGRPEKKEDVCYSWWVMSSMATLGKLHWIDGEKLTKFILQCQVRAQVQETTVDVDMRRTPNWVVSLIAQATW